MSLRRLDILRMPGFERQGYDLDDLSPGLNLIHGPNASGKTTACRAIRGLLWPETLDGARPVYLRGEWNLQDGAMDMELIDGRRNCRRHGAPSEPPELPPAHEAGCFTITADDLGGASDDDQRLAGQIARQLAGGYDLPAVRKSDWLSLGQRTGYSERDALQAARDQVNEIRRRQQALRSEQQRLGQLQADAQAAADAQVSLQYLQAALERAARAGELRDVEARLAEFPDAMDALTGGEPERLNERRAELDQARQDLQQAETQIAQAEAELAATTFAGREPTREELSEQKTHLNQWRELSRQVDALTEKLTDAQGRLEEASEAVGGSAVEDLAELDTDALDGLDQFHQELVTQRQRVSAVEAELAGLGEAETPSDAQGADANTLLAGAGFLRRILRGDGADGPLGAVSGWKLAVIPAMIVVTGLIALVHSWAAVAVGAVAAGVALMLLARQPRPSRGEDPAVQYARAEFQRLNLTEPAGWDDASVAARLEEIQRELTDTRQRESQAVRADDLRRRLQREQQALGELEQRCSELAQRVGLGPDAGDLAVVTLAKNLAAWQQARGDCRGLAGRLQPLTGQLDQRRETVNQFLHAIGAEAAETHDIARVRLDAADETLTGRQQANRDLSDGRGDRDRTRRRIDNLESRIADIYRQAGIDDHDEAELSRRVEMLETWKQLRQQQRDLQGQLSAIEQRLEGREDLLTLSAEDVRDRIERAKEQAQRLDALREEIAEIKARVEQAGRGREMTDALAAVDRAKDALRDARSRLERCELGRMLLAEVAEEHRSTAAPAVLVKAGQWFAEFTRGAFDLQVQPGEDRRMNFVARDTTSGRIRQVGQLSRGTRMQLLLAVRLAFATHTERAETLPLVLDEVLGNTDPQRFRAVIDALVTMVRTGRQVFYMTCQPGDREAFAAVAERDGLQAFKTIELGQGSGTPDDDLELLSQASTGRADVPSPRADESITEYAGRLGAEPVDLARGAGPIHLGHLLGSPQTLCGLLRAGLSRWGQLQTLTEAGVTDRFVDAQQYARMAARAAVVTATAEAWRIGRGRSVTPEALREAGLRDTFAERIVSLAADLNWNAADLVDTIEARRDERTRGFRKQTLEEMRENLLAEGYIDPREPLTREQALARVLDRVETGEDDDHLSRQEVVDLFDYLWTSTGSNSAGKEIS